MSICIVVPVYNEAERLQPKVFKGFLQLNQEACFLFVNDGSKDGSQLLIEEIQSFCPERVFMISNSNNIGKANSIRNGMLYATEHLTSTLIGFLDADLSVLPDNLINFGKTLTRSNALAIFGFRNMLDTRNVKRSFHRRIMGILFRNLAKLILRFQIIDTQCGAKLFKSETIQPLFKKPFLTHWLVDIELLKRINDLYPNTNIKSLIIELPVSSFEDKKGSKLTPFELLRITSELLKLFIL